MSTDVVGTIKLPPDAGLVKSLGTHHTLESALADLVDNSLDKHASLISIYLLTKSDRLVRIEVVDNGTGMNSTDADQAMTLGYQRQYDSTSHGHFGIGLKSASFAHADELTVWSSQNGHKPVGRRIRRSDFSRDFSCDQLSTAAAEHAKTRRAAQTASQQGTTVVWEGLRSTYAGSAEEARAWLSRTEFDIRSHLGIVFHKIIERATVTIKIFTEQVELAHEAMGVNVAAVDPFGYSQTGHPGYPKSITASHKGHEIALTYHIWPAKTDIPGFRLYGKPGEHFQGFFIYRNERLLQIGGWSQVATASRKRQLARVLIDTPAALGKLISLEPEKAGLHFEQGADQALAAAKSPDGTTFTEYLEDAETIYTTASRRSKRRHPVITPDRGFGPSVRRRIEGEFGLRETDILGVRWIPMENSELFDIDFDNSELLLNQSHRHLFAPQGGSLNDAPVLKTLLFLLTHQIFEGIHLGSKEKDDIKAWKVVLGAAVFAETNMRG